MITQTIKVAWSRVFEFKGKRRRRRRKEKNWKWILLLRKVIKVTAKTFHPKNSKYGTRYHYINNNISLVFTGRPFQSSNSTPPKLLKKKKILPTAKSQKCYHEYKFTHLTSAPFSKSRPPLTKPTSVLPPLKLKPKILHIL